MENMIDPGQFVGMSGNVTPLDDDIFCHEFEGTCIGVRHGFLQIRDQNDNVYEVEARQFTPYASQNDNVYEVEARQFTPNKVTTINMNSHVQLTSYLLTASRVNEVFMNCLFTDDESTDEYVVGEASTIKMGFHPERISKHKEEILEMLHQLPDSFQENKGGGMSFLEACFTRHGDQWGEHKNIDQLLALGVATNQAKILLPREFWVMLPGGMPYFSVSS